MLCLLRGSLFIFACLLAVLLSLSTTSCMLVGVQDMEKLLSNSIHRWEDIERSRETLQKLEEKGRNNWDMQDKALYESNRVTLKNLE